MIKVVAKHKVLQDEVQTFIKVAEPLVEETNKEAGCLCYELCQDLKDTSILTILEEWEDQASLDAHMKSPHFVEIVPKLGKLLDGAAEVTLYRKLY